MLSARLLKKEPIELDVEVAEEPAEEVEVGTRSWPRVEVLSCSARVSKALKAWRIEVAYPDDIVIFHKARFMARKET